MLISTLDDPVDTIVLTATQGNGFEIYAGRTNETLTVDNNQNEYDISTPLDSDNTLNELSEDASIGSLVGITAYAEDLDIADSVSYILSDDAGGLFAIDSQSGVVTLAGQLDYETQTSHMISVLC